MMPNGLWVVHQEMSAPPVAITLHSKGGSGVENTDEIGLAHFVEHMAFKGSDKYPDENLISEMIEQEGAQTNAFTSHDRVCFYIHTQTNIELMFGILANAVLHPLFREKDIEVERGAILQEIADGMDSPDNMIAKLFGEMIWGKHSYGGDITGTKEQVASLGRDSFLNYYAKYFTPRNLVLSVAGGIKAAKVFDLAFQYFGDNVKVAGERAKMPEIDYSYKPPDRISLLHKDFEQVKCCLGVLPREWIAYNKEHEKERIATGLLAIILGGGMSSRLFRTIRAQRGLVYYIMAGLSVFENGGDFWIDFGAEPTNFPRVISLIFDELDNLLKNGVSENELAKVKNCQKMNYAIGQESSLRSALIGGDAELKGLDLQTPEEYFKSHIDPISISDVMDIAKRLLPKENFYLAAMGKVENHSKELEDLFGA